jgi:hypothetical protein
MKSTVFLLAFTFNITLKAQQWLWAKLADSTSSSLSFSRLESDGNSNFYFTETHKSNVYPYNSIGASVIKIDTYGNEIWRENLSGSIWIEGIAKSGNDLYVTGSFIDTILLGTNILTSNGPSDIFIAQFTSTGVISWAKNFGGNGVDFGRDIFEDVNGNLFITGACSSGIIFGNATHNFPNPASVFIVKLDAIGNTLFSKIFGSGLGDASCYGNKVNTDSTGHIYLLGSFNQDIALDSIYYPSYGEDDNFLCKLDTAGGVLWADRLGGYGYTVKDLALDQAENIFINGSYEANHGGGYIGVYKYNPAGQIIWSKLFPSPYPNSIYPGGIALDNYNSYVIGHNWNCPTYNYCYQQLALAKCDSAGSLLFYDTLKVTGNNVSQTQILSSSNGEFVICGTLKGNIKIGNDSLASSQDRFFIAKFSENGNTYVNNLTPEAEINIFPNPSSGIFTVDMHSCHEAKLSVCDVLGNRLLVKDCRGDASPQIDLNSQPKGMYYMEIVSEGERVVKKIVLE